MHANYILIKDYKKVTSEFISIVQLQSFSVVKYEVTIRLPIDVFKLSNNLRYKRPSSVYDFCR